MKKIIVFEVSQEEDGGFVAECLTEDIFTQGDTWEDLKTNTNEAVKGFYFDQPRYVAVGGKNAHQEIEAD